ncbi:cytokinin dehydrogenase 3-like protein [Tanacetum coccineum]
MIRYVFRKLKIIRSHLVTSLRRSQLSLAASLQIGHGEATVLATFRTHRGFYDAGSTIGKSGCWSILKGGLTVNESGSALLYFQSKNASIDISVDSVSLQPFTQEEWKSTYQSIEKNRKQVKLQEVNSEGKPLANRTLTVAQKFANFPFGCAINRNILANSDYQNWFLSNLNLKVKEVASRGILYVNSAGERFMGIMNFTCICQPNISPVIYAKVFFQTSLGARRGSPINNNQPVKEKLQMRQRSRVTLVIGEGTRSIHTTISTPNPEGGGGGRGMKEKQHSSVNDTIKDTFMVASAVDELDSTNTKGKQEGNVGKTPSSSTVDPNIGPTSYAKLVTGEPSRKSVNFHTLITPARNGVDVAIPLELLELLANDFLIRNMVSFWKAGDLPRGIQIEDGLSAIAIGTPFMLDSYTSDMCMQSWGRSRYARAIIELRADVELKDAIMVSMPKLVGEGFYTCTIRVKYEWKPPMCACCKVFGHVQDKYPKNIGLNVVKNLKNPSQAPRGILVCPKVGFKLVKQVYKPVSKKNNSNTSGNKKKDDEPRKEVSNPNPFDVLNSFENDVDLGTNGGTSNLASKEANFSGSLFWNVGSNSTSTTPIDEVESVNNEMASFLASKLVDFGTNSLSPLAPTGNVDSESEVEVVFDETANLIDSTSFKGRSDKGYGTNCLLEQGRDIKQDDDYDPYDDDLYKSHDMSDHL